MTTRSMPTRSMFSHSMSPVSQLRPGIRRWGARALVLGLLAGSGCLPPVGQRMDELREGLIGIPARDLRGCIGVPFDTTIDGDTEYLTYRWFQEEEPLDPFDRASERFPGSRGEVSRGRDLRRERIEDPQAPIPRGIGYCELVFEIREGRVRHVDAEGRRPSGLNDDYRCLSTAEGCMRPRAASPAASDLTYRPVGPERPELTDRAR